MELFLALTVAFATAMLPSEIESRSLVSAALPFLLAGSLVGPALLRGPFLTDMGDGVEHAPRAGTPGAGGGE